MENIVSQSVDFFFFPEGMGMFTGGLETNTESRTLPHWESLGCAGEDFFAAVFHHQYKDFWKEMNATQDGNKCCDIV